MKRASAALAAVLMPAWAWAASSDWTLTPADVQGSPSSRDWLPPPDHPVIAYERRPTTDVVARLAGDLEAGRAKLAFDPASGYLSALLDTLKVPADSQLLLFARTSLQRRYIAPQTPRAIYFSPEVAVAYIKDAPMIEISVQDPAQGRVFYTLDQIDTPEPRLQREMDCLGCHLSRASMGVPGTLDRSVSATLIGRVIARLGSRTPDHRTPISERWGGWYVTSGDGLKHSGNVALPEEDIDGPPIDVSPFTTKLTEIGYPSGSSDAAVHLVFDHQMQMGNLLARIGWDARIAISQGDAALTRTLLANDAREVVDYMLFVDEAPLPAPVKSSAYVKTFSAQGPRDKKGRGLYQLDLTTRLLRYPCSYMIYSPAFDALPAEARAAIYARMAEVLNSGGGRLSAANRQAVKEILLETKPAARAYFRTG